MLRIGLTGGIASGKSAVAKLFAELGVDVIDTDIVAREVVAPGQPALAEIIEAFGPDVLESDGSLNRTAMRSIVFADPRQRGLLESILHPRIRERALHQAEGHAGPYQIFVVPLLVETDFGALVDRVLVVDCPPELQRARLMQRDALSAADADRIIGSQASRDSRLRAADDAVSNDGDMAKLVTAVARLHSRYLELAGASD